MERARYLFRFGGSLPLAIDGRETARKESAVRAPVDDFEEILAEVGVVDRLAPGPRERLDDDAVEADPLVRRAAGVLIVESHRARRDG